MPKTGRCVICANHLSNYDAIILTAYIDRNINWMAKKELFKNPLIRKVVEYFGAFPVDREGNDIGAIKKSLKILNDDGVLGIFPEGARIRFLNNKPENKPGVIMLAHKTSSPIIPIRIKTDYKLFKPINIIIGDEFDFDRLEDKPNYTKISAELMRYIYSM